MAAPAPCRIQVVVLTAMAGYGFLLAVYLARNSGDFSALLCSGDLFAGQPAYRYVTRQLGPRGHDGQFYYAFAQAPWDRHDVDEIDLPAPRQMRILYPAVCWLLSGGDGRLLFYVMPAVNLAAILWMTWLAAALAARQGMSPWWGLLFPVGCNAGLSLLYNFTDNVGTLAVFGLLCAWLTGARGWVIVLWFAAAVFSREQNVAVAAVAVLAAAWTRRYTVLAGFGLVLGLLLVWVAYLHALYGTWPVLQSQGHFNLPGQGLWYAWQHRGGAERFSTRVAIVQCAALFHLIALIGLAAYLAFRQPSRFVALVLLGGVALALVIDHFIYRDFRSYTRVFVWLPMGIWLAALQLRVRWPMGALAPAGLWPVVAILGYI